MEMVVCKFSGTKASLNCSDWLFFTQVHQNHVLEWCDLVKTERYQEYVRAFPTNGRYTLLAN